MDTKHIKKFYDQFDRKLMEDYLHRNARIEAAIGFTLSQIPIQSKNILDLGCGIGWSTFEMAKQYPNSQVSGIDLSPQLIQTAEKLFGNLPNIAFKRLDLMNDKIVSDHCFDVFVLLDVYEHIPIEKRAHLHNIISNIISKNGIIILSCPTKHHQQWLEINNPTNLQPVDCIVTLETLQGFAKDIEGEIIFFENKHIWNTNDYFHAVVQKNPTYQRLPFKRRPNHLEPIHQRFRRVNKHFRGQFPSFREYIFEKIKNRLSR